MAFSVNDFETMNLELDSVFDSCACKEKNERIKVQVLIDKLSEIYGKEAIMVFKESLIQTQGISALNRSVSKDEFVTIMKNIYSGFQTIGEISTPNRLRRISNVKSSTPTTTNRISPQNVFKDESFEIQQISPIHNSNIWKQYGNQTLAFINESLEKKLTVAESAIQRLEEKLKNEKSINQKITKDFESLREEAKRLWNSEEQLVEANGKLNTLEVKYRAIKTEFVKTKEELELLESQNTYLQNENAVKDQDLKKQVQKTNKLEECNNELANEIIALKGTVNQLQNEISEMNNQHLHLNNRIEQLKNEKQELRLQLMDTDRVVTNEAMWPSYCMNVSKESSSPNGRYLQNTSQDNNNHQTLFSELTSLSDYPFLGTLFDSNSTDSKKDLSHKYTQTDLLELCDIGTLTCSSETLQDNFTQTYKQVSDVGVYALLPAPSEQLTATRGVQVDFNSFPMETRRQPNEAEENEEMINKKKYFKNIGEIENEYNNNRLNSNVLNSDLIQEILFKNDDVTKDVHIDTSVKIFREYTENKQTSDSNNSISCKNGDVYNSAVTYDFHQIRYRNGSCGRTSTFSRGRVITHISKDKASKTYRPRSRFIFCVMLCCIIIVATIFLMASLVTDRSCILYNKCTSCWSPLSNIITFSYRTGHPPV